MQTLFPTDPLNYIFSELDILCYLIELDINTVSADLNKRENRLLRELEFQDNDAAYYRQKR